MKHSSREQRKRNATRKKPPKKQHPSRGRRRRARRGKEKEIHSKCAPGNRGRGAKSSCRLQQKTESRSRRRPPKTPGFPNPPPHTHTHTPSKDSRNPRKKIKERRTAAGESKTTRIDGYARRKGQEGPRHPGQRQQSELDSSSGFMDPEYTNPDHAMPDSAV